MKKMEHNDLKDMVYTMSSRYKETTVILDIKYVAANTTGHTLTPGNFGTGDIN